MFPALSCKPTKEDIMTRAKSHREKWANEHALKRVKEALRDKTLARLGELDKPSSVISQAVSVHVVTECDLRSTLEEKTTRLHRFAGWTAFVNRAGTLIHVLPKEGDFHIRIPLYGRSIKNCTLPYIERLVQSYAQGRLR
jgi:hypothetical protein